ncbi:hypothetical protein BB558_003198 [Smittium angustum]|uniref:Uncharacterized protein n=1 Tax=Smittium angustum TaxID=133377 RepID=A0A2U1J6L2_SMIAN|nr:hypothetical protein BB558_003198 [Smittium angustum]
MKSYGKTSSLTALLTFCSIAAGSCIDLTLKASSIGGNFITQAILRENGNIKISLSKNIPNGSPSHQIFKENGYELTVYHKENIWTLDMPKHFSRKRTLKWDLIYCGDTKQSCWWVYQDSYCFQ